MSKIVNTKIVTSGLCLYTDPGNLRSYMGSGTIIKNLTNNQSGTITGPTFSTSNFGYFNFDGIDDKIEFTDFDSISNLTGDLTICAWCYFNSYKTNGSSIVAKTLTNIPAPFDYYLEGNFAVLGRPRILRGNGTVHGLSSALNNPSLNMWSHLCITMQGSSVIHYLNNVQNGTGTISTTIGDNNSNLIIGNRIDGVPPLHGRIGPLMIYNRALSPAEISENFNVHRHRYGI